MWRRLFLLCILIAAPAGAQEPPLPSGLGQPQQDEESEKTNDEPNFPSRLEPSEPDLPSGLGAPARETRVAQERERDTDFLPITGFLEGRLGPRLQNDPNEGAFTIGEARLRLEAQWEPGDIVVRVVGDGVFDQVVKAREPDLETGEGAFDLREANLVWRPLSFADLKVGRQILTWGIGDLIFINDLFPKDFNSFFIGRDEEYLKAPSDAVRISLFHEFANIDLVYTPRFDADRFIDGARLSYFNPIAGGVVGENLILNPVTPDDWFSDDEFAARAYRQIGAFEVAAYGYAGHYKGPSGLTPTGGFYFPKLAVYGASLRGPWRGGIVTAEFGRYISQDDPPGADPLVPNSDLRILLGYEKDVADELTASGQIYAQMRSDHDAFIKALPIGAEPRDRVRYLLTVRLTKRALNQNLTLSAFNFWSPNEQDGHLRLRASYKLNDDWLVESGGNFFYGPRNDIFFSQLKDNTNLFFAARRSF